MGLEAVPLSPDGSLTAPLLEVAAAATRGRCGAWLEPAVLLGNRDNYQVSNYVLCHPPRVSTASGCTSHQVHILA